MTSPYIDRIDLTGKSVFVAGGTSGINLGIAEDFARASARVALMSRSQEKVHATVNQLRALAARRSAPALMFVTTQPPKRPWRQQANSSGSFDVLISGAAGNFPAAAFRLSPNGFKSVVDIELLGTFNVLRAAYRSWPSRVRR
jgi:NAD(P)-dependent dehydrogenase (short-subunit alcohol dehydrogenase family)